MHTIPEAAKYFKCSIVNVRRYIELGQLAARQATPDEIANLIAAGRVKVLTRYGIRVIDDEALRGFQKRPAHRVKKTP